jgi:hypothetical protein
VTDTEPYDPKKMLSETKESLEAYMGRGTPPPGDAWIKEVEALQRKQIEIVASTPEDISRKQWVDQELVRFKSFVETNKHDVPISVGRGSDLGKSLFQLASTLDFLAHKSSASRGTPDIETEFASFEAKRLAGIDDDVKMQYQTRIEPIATKHATRLREIQRATIELEEKVAATTEEGTSIQRDAERRLLRQKMAQEYERDRAEIERLLSPFISLAYTQLGEHENHWINSPERNPISYRDLERLSALQPNMTGLYKLYYIGGVPTLHTPNTCRPLGSFPEYTTGTLSNPTTLQAVKRAQELLRKHGEYLVEIGSLLP